MKLNDMTLADIDMAAARNAEQYVKPFKGSAKSAFIEGACWAYEYLTKQGNTPAWCEQNVTNKETKFNSQVCTSIEQSKALLALGLKKETADMFYESYGNGEHDVYSRYMLTDNDIKKGQGHYGRAIFIPAWSLHRLIEIVDNTRAFRNWLGADIVRDYDHLIDIIKIYIEEGIVNEEYLEE